MIFKNFSFNDTFGENLQKKKFNVIKKFLIQFINKEKKANNEEEKKSSSVHCTKKEFQIFMLFTTNVVCYIRFFIGTFFTRLFIKFNG